MVPLAASLLGLAVVRGPGERHELGMGGGVGEYWFTGCNTPRHDGGFAELQAWYRLQQAHGLSLAGELSVGGGRDRESHPPPEPDGSSRAAPWRSRLGGVLALRIGYHFRYAGFEAGPALTKLRLGDGEHLGVLPSARVWAGVPRYAYGFASLLADETRGQSRILGVGIGHAGANLRLDAGVSRSQGNDGCAFADVAFRVLPAVWVGAGGQFGGRDTWSLFGTAILDLALLDGAP